MFPQTLFNLATLPAILGLGANFDWQFAVVLAIVAVAARQVTGQFVSTWKNPDKCQGCSSNGCQPADNLVSLELPQESRQGTQR